MLDIPTVGFARSIKEHNVDLDALCDWIEGNVLFEGEELSESNVVDVLCENEVYDSQQFAWEIVGDAWRELARRIGWLNAGSPLTFKGRRLSRVQDWTEVPAHSFCLCLAYAKFYPAWAASFGSNYTAQGEYFEALTVESLGKHFPNWKIHLTGWSRTNTKKLAGVVEDVAAALGEPIGNLKKWTSASANEAGLDIVCHRSFEDTRPSAPVLLVQCASGKHYEGKLHTPNLRIWCRIVEFTCKPSKAFSTPFALENDEFTQVTNLVNGMVLDRYRLLAPGRTDRNWLSARLSADILAWATPRIGDLPRLDT